MKHEILASRPLRPGIKPLRLTREEELIAEFEIRHNTGLSQSVAEGLVIDAKSPRPTPGGVYVVKRALAS